MSLSHQPIGYPIQQPKIPTPTLIYEFIAAGTGMDARPQLERFIKNGFLTTYHADLKNFMPLLFGIQAQGLRAAVGVRRANQPLFIEQYLPLPITNMLEKHGVYSPRSRIAELGNLYSKNHRFTLPLLLTVVIGLYLSDVDYLVFSGTAHIRQLLAKPNLPMTFLYDANPEKLEGSHCWGSYFQYQPKVMLLDISKAVAVVYEQAPLGALLNLVQANLPSLIAAMRTL